MANFPLGVEPVEMPRAKRLCWPVQAGRSLDLIAPKEEPFPQRLHPLPGEHGLDVRAQLSSQISGFETICLRAGAEAQARAVPFNR